MRIMSFNLLCQGKDEHAMKNRRELASRTIMDYRPDSIGVQEATPDWMKWLGKNLPGYDYVGVGRDDGKKLGEFAAIFFLKDKYKAVDSGTFWLSATPEKPTMGWDAVCIRICTWAVLQNIQTGEQYAHINTHLDHRGDTAREKGIDLVLKKAAEFELPVVCTGDFNLFEGSPLYEQLMGGVLRDTKFLAPDTMKNATFHHFSLPTVDTNIIDYVLVNDKVTPLVYRVITEGIDGKFVSDHYPVYADVVL
jgi:endonuclease/exonuclease/phosphatase family metal-dependent hydrolase